MHFIPTKTLTTLTTPGVLTSRRDTLRSLWQQALQLFNAMPRIKVRTPQGLRRDSGVTIQAIQNRPKPQREWEIWGFPES